jgi:hypothetical protein
VGAGGGLRRGQGGVSARADTGPGPRQAEAGEAHIRQGASPHAAPARPGAPTVALPRAGADFDRPGSRLAARGPKSWGGHTRGELWPGGPGQARVLYRRNLAPPSSCSGGLRLARTTTLAQGRVVLDGGHTPVKIFFCLRLQNLFPVVCPPSVAKGKWLAVVLCCACLRVEAMVSMSARSSCSKGGGYGFNVGALF